MDEEGVRQPSGPPTRKKFFIPLDEDEAPPAGFKPLFKSTRSLPTMETSAQAAPQTYAEYAISGSPGGAGAPHPTGPEPLAGETPNQAPKPGTKSSSIIVSPRQRGNPVLKFVRNVPWEFGDVLPDYVLGQSTCALFLRVPQVPDIQGELMRARISPACTAVKQVPSPFPGAPLHTELDGGSEPSKFLSSLQGTRAGGCWAEMSPSSLGGEATPAPPCQCLPRLKQTVPGMGLLPKTSCPVPPSPHPLGTCLLSSTRSPSLFPSPVRNLGSIPPGKPEPVSPFRQPRRPLP
ncbi:DNA excision repair protein ERCC-1 isoform X2 [Prionailurus viverrinus]|uniref:DNA excision repair protein ERCC-1 isoform X2 n=1 Tax=Prionailurus viverrinus TaxID=61388 RepID=UPI001FF150F2|nr:DNA excision repair protein ERCC-1 isoform X2 [Prionailurus viverrinus]